MAERTDGHQQLILALQGNRAAMTSCDLDTSVPDWVIEHPETLLVFRELGIDYCCGASRWRMRVANKDLMRRKC